MGCTSPLVRTALSTVPVHGSTILRVYVTHDRRFVRELQVAIVWLDIRYHSAHVQVVSAMQRPQTTLLEHQDLLSHCRRCPRMQSVPVIGNPVVSGVLLVGQAPGPREAALGRPFAWTAGKMLFKWFGEIGIDEEAFRGRVYMAAVCRCFPGKRPAGGDRVPDPDEVANCSSWLDAEIAINKPKLVIPVGKLAIQQFMPVDKLDAVVGQLHKGKRNGVTFDLAPLPHPSGASTWQHVQPGKTLLPRALNLIASHPAWKAITTKDTKDTKESRTKNETR
jgi:uracil-DNA glycosylase